MRRCPGCQHPGQLLVLVAPQKWACLQPDGEAEAQRDPHPHFPPSTQALEGGNQLPRPGSRPWAGTVGSLAWGDTVLDVRLLQGLHGLHHREQFCHVVIPGKCACQAVAAQAPSPAGAGVAELRIWPSQTHVLLTLGVGWVWAAGRGGVCGWVWAGGRRGVCGEQAASVRTHFSRSRAFLYSFTSCWREGRASAPWGLLAWAFAVG